MDDKDEDGREDLSASHYRTEICGLPPWMALPPPEEGDSEDDSVDDSVDDSEDDDDYDDDEDRLAVDRRSNSERAREYRARRIATAGVVWHAQIEEARLASLARDRLRSLMRRIGRGRPAADSPGGGRGLWEAALRESFGGTFAASTLQPRNDEGHPELPAFFFEGETLENTPTIYDLEELCSRLDGPPGCGDDGDGGDTLRSFVADSLRPSRGGGSGDDGEEYDDYWRERILRHFVGGAARDDAAPIDGSDTDANASDENRRRQGSERSREVLEWRCLLEASYLDAASDVLKLHRRRLPRADATTADPAPEKSGAAVESEAEDRAETEEEKDPSPSEARDYLRHRAAIVARRTRAFALPARRRRIDRMGDRLRGERRAAAEWERRYDEAFSDYDDRCLEAFGLGSDTLPLYPEDGDEGEDRTETHARELERRVSEALRKEYRAACECVASSIAIVPEATAASGENNAENTEDQRTNNTKCFGKDLAAAAAHYWRFAAFVSSPRWNGVDEGEGDNGDDIGNDVPTPLLPTLRRFLAGGPGDSLVETPAEEFARSPSARVSLVADLEELRSFSISRRREERSPRSGGGGRAVAESVAVALASFGHGTAVAPAPSGASCESAPPPSEKGEGATSEDDLERFLTATEGVLATVTGDGGRAKRLRFLAGAVGRGGGRSGSDVSPPGRTYRKVSELARRMTLCRDREDACEREAERIEGEMREEEDGLASLKHRAKSVLECLKRDRDRAPFG